MTAASEVEESATAIAEIFSEKLYMTQTETWSGVVASPQDSTACQSAWKPVATIGHKLKPSRNPGCRGSHTGTCSGSMLQGRNVT